MENDDECPIVCMQSPTAPEFWCKHDGSRHSCYCPVSLDVVADGHLQAIARLQAVAAEGAIIELAEQGFLDCINSTSPRCGGCTTCRAHGIAIELMAARADEGDGL